MDENVNGRAKTRSSTPCSDAPRPIRGAGRKKKRPVSRALAMHQRLADRETRSNRTAQTSWAGNDGLRDPVFLIGLSGYIVFLLCSFQVEEPWFGGQHREAGPHPSSVAELARARTEARSVKLAGRPQLRSIIVFAFSPPVPPARHIRRNRRISAPAGETRPKGWGRASAGARGFLFFVLYFQGRRAGSPRAGDLPLPTGGAILI